MKRPQHTYRVHFEPEPEGGYTVTVPSLPGCITWGEDYDDAVEKVRECISGFLEALTKAGDPIPALFLPQPGRRLPIFCQQMRQHHRGVEVNHRSSRS